MIFMSDSDSENAPGLYNYPMENAKRQTAKVSSN